MIWEVECGRLFSFCNKALSSFELQKTLGSANSFEKAIMKSLAISRPSQRAIHHGFNFGMVFFVESNLIQSENLLIKLNLI